MSGLVKDKICLITGAGRGIGKAMAELFVENGAIVYANDSREGCMDVWISEWESKMPGKMHAVYFDITDEEQVKHAVTSVRKESKHIDVLVNNAGVEYNELIGMISRKNMELMLNVNVIGVVNMLQMVSRVMQKQPQGGSIVNITSMTALRGNRGQLVYSATKGAVLSITKSAAKELAAKKIRVNAIAPGLTLTPMMAQADPEKLQERIHNVCMGRLAEPLDIAKVCLFLASDLSGYVSGQVLPVDGCTIM